MHKKRKNKDNFYSFFYFYEDSVYMVDNLGIYNSHVNSNYDINKHIEQGVQFKQYGKNIYPANKHIFLQESSSKEWGSVADAYNGDNSVIKRGVIEGMTMSEDQVQFNNLVSQYANDYKIYVSTFLNQPKTANYDENRQAAEDALLIQKNNIISLSNQLNIDAEESMNSLVNLSDMYNNAQTEMQLKSNDINNYRDNQKEYDNVSVDGALEYTALQMNSNYYHVFVYLLVAATLLGFIFNLMMNPEANVLYAIYVLGALFVVYFISRYYTI